jgi:hypothetical protein
VIQKLATPNEIRKDSDDAGFDERLNGSVVVKPHHYKCFMRVNDEGKSVAIYDGSPIGVDVGEGFPIRCVAKWPGTIREMSQDLIISMFKGNEKLCLYLAEGVNTDPLLDVFAFVANQSHSDPNLHVDTAPVLDFFFHLCMPTTERCLQESHYVYIERILVY